MSPSNLIDKKCQDSKSFNSSTYGKTSFSRSSLDETYSLDQRTNFNGSNLDWAKSSGLIPAIVQHHTTRKVLMVGMVSKESLDMTLKTGLVTFFSRTKKRLWVKGESSGHKLKLVHLAVDCDGDAILLTAKPLGPTCHKGTESCFETNASYPLIDSQENSAWQFLRELDESIRKKDLTRGNVALSKTQTNTSSTEPLSYTQRLLNEGPGRCAQKIGEEGVELALAVASLDQTEVISEASDLLYHIIVGLRSRGLSILDVLEELSRRSKK